MGATGAKGATVSVAYPEGRTEIAGAKPAASADWRASLLLAWFGAVVPLTAVGVAAFALTRNRTLADLFFLGQDFSVVLITAAFMLALRLAPLRKLADVAAPSWLQDRPGVQLALLAGAPALLAGAGWFVVCHAYPLSLDEFMAGFDRMPPVESTSAVST